jgi:hypothetical protein
MKAKLSVSTSMFKSRNKMYTPNYLVRVYKTKAFRVTMLEKSNVVELFG